MSSDYPAGVLQKLHDIELAILQEIDRICKELDLSYWIDSGTCLGAVRHGGFIPWDDDIDIGMPLDDYRTFITAAPQLLPDNLSLHTCNNTEHFPVLWAQIFCKGTQFSTERDLEAGLRRGIFVDVFPYINVDERPNISTQQHKRLALLQNLSYLNVYKHPATYQYTKHAFLAARACEFLHLTLARPFTPQRMAQAAEKYLTVETPGTEWRPAFAFTSLKHNLPESCLLPTKPIEFEGELFMGPADPDAYLRHLYGNYMQIPPVEKQHTHTPAILDFGNGNNVMDPAGILDAHLDS